MAETNYSAIDFSQLSATDDGKTILYKDGQLCQSEKSLSEVVSDKIDDKGFATETFVSSAIGDLSEAISEVYSTKEELVDVSNSIENLSGTVSAEYATKEELGNVGNFIITSADVETGEPIIEPSAAQTKSIYLIKNETVTGTDQYKEWIVTENESDEKVWTCIGDTSVDLSDYALSADVNTKLALKEDKVFVAEYGVTTYQAIKNAYDEGRQIICKYQINSAQLAYAQLSQFIDVSNTFVFINSLSTQTIQIVCKKQEEQTVWDEPVFQHFYDTTATSGSQQLADAFNAKQSNIARVGGSGPLFGDSMNYRISPEGGTNLNLQEYNSATNSYDDIGLIITKENKGPNKILKTDSQNILQWITPDYYTKTETSGADELSAAFDALGNTSSNVDSGDSNIKVYETDGDMIIEKTESGTTETINLPYYGPLNNKEIKITFPKNITEYDFINLIVSQNVTREGSIDLKNANIGDVFDVVKIKDKTENTITLNSESGSYITLKYITTQPGNTKVVKLNGTNNKIINLNDTTTLTGQQNAIVLGENNNYYNRGGAEEIIIGHGNEVSGYESFGGNNIVLGNYGKINNYGTQYSIINGYSISSKTVPYSYLNGSNISATNSTGNIVTKYGSHNLNISGNSNILNLSGGTSYSTIYTYNVSGNLNTVIGTIKDVSGYTNIIYGMGNEPIYGNNNVIVGSSNYINESWSNVRIYHNFIHGNNNTAYSASGCVVFGDQNKISESKGTFIYGSQNNYNWNGETTALSCRIFGDNNRIYSAKTTTIFGYSNTAMYCLNTFMTLDYNQIMNSNSINAIGNSNYISASTALNVNGGSNCVSGSQSTVINGFCITSLYTNYSNIEGYYNRCDSGTYVHIEGYYNSGWYRTPVAGDEAYIKYNHIGGYHNAATNSAETVIGKYNKLDETYISRPLFVVGNGTGTATNKRSDGFVVTEDGTASATKLSTSGFQDVEQAIKDIAAINTYEVVNGSTTADITNPTTKTIYLIKDTTVTGSDQYSEWICTNTATPTFVKIGDTSIDLTPYLTKTSADVDYQPKGDYVPLSTYNTMTAKVQELETLLNTYSGLWVLTNQPSNNG